MSDTPYIIDVTAENFEQVMQTSFETPVLLDFWASWCQPCQMLMPVLARLAEEYEGKFLLGKLNTEENQEIAAHFGIRSIPTVKLFREGQAVDEFMGALPEQAIREFLDRHVELEPQEQLAGIAEAHEYLIAGDIAAAEAALDSLPDEQQEKPEVTSLRSRLFFASQLLDAPATDELEAKLAADPNDSKTFYQLALRKVVEEDYDTAMDLLLQLMQRDRGFEDDAGRLGLLKVFELLGDDARVSQYRRRMASLLY